MLQDKLQQEFCPPLDTSLVAALVNEYEAEADSQSRSSLSAEQLYDLRNTLSKLAKQAEKDEEALSDKMADFHISPHSFTTDGSSIITDDFSPGQTISSGTSLSPSDVSFGSPLGFLQAAFPQIDTALLRRALQTCEDDENVDMESVVHELLTQEYLHDLEERGLDALSEEEIIEEAWETVQSQKKKGRAGPSTPKILKPKARKIAITDVRQQQHIRPSPTRRSTSPIPRGAPDPWTQVSSLSSYLSTLLPKPASYFQSIFHKPEYSSPSEALRAALTSLAPDTLNSELSPSETQSLFNLFEIFTASPAYAQLDAPARKQIMTDAELALRATQGRSDEALDIVSLLRDLDGDAYLELGVYHSPAPTSPAVSDAWSSLPSSPVVQRSPAPKTKPSVPSKGKAKHKPPAPPKQNAWHQIPRRKVHGPHPLASYIPAYNNAKIKGSGNGLGKGGKGNISELKPREMRKAARTEEFRMKRNEALREASRYWQSGSAKTRGGEIAYYFADRAREYRELERAAALDAAKSMIEEKRACSSDKSSVDLHGTTIAEAIVIVKDILRAESASGAKPLRVITGRGNHSANRVGVLGPAVRSALEEDGWHVSSFDGGLVVRGRSR
ncbi:hypothetical protein NEOLEDRAFT_1139855 [Neolentinus lepideus HHB14362 ss-1]|uniref:Smr domain-containing protein n=1 Tax=Neolentinus lepideus HHB14362 ss-1 TaxID=1314782 RepID=A0A165PLG1_9AGAM|nr:hypothetical protein NEOLEDRAFT_1139855 [Neolentinus lepideus HHB14362 ss-1]